MDGDNLKIDKIIPTGGPLLEEPHVVAFHQLKAAVEVHFYPAIDVPQAFRQHPALLSKASIHGRGVVIPKPLDYHEEHRFSPCPRKHRYVFLAGSVPTNFTAR